MYGPIIPDPGTIDGVERAIGTITKNGTEAVERGAAQIAGGAVSDILHLPQPALNALYNVSGIIIGTAMMFIGAGLIAVWLLGESLSGIADVVGDVIQPIEKDLDKAAGATPGTTGKVASKAAEALIE